MDGKDLSKLNVKELRLLCKQRCIRGYSGKNRQELIDMLEKFDNPKTPVNIIDKRIQSKETVIDNYTQEILESRYKMYMADYIQTSKIIKTTGLKIRHQNPPEDITENIVKFAIINSGHDESCVWAKSIGQKGDLYSKKFNKSLEVKSFSSDGPCSFGPTKEFTTIYFFDMRKFLNNKFIVWCLNISSNSPEWKNLKMNKTQTIEEQCLEKRRPHIGWVKIYEQIPEHFEKIYEGSFENIFVKIKTESFIN